MLKKKAEEITENGVVYIIETYTNSKGEVKGKTKYPKSTDTLSKPVDPEPSQLDLIQQAVEKSNNELRQEGADALMLELINKNII